MYDRKAKKMSPPQGLKCKTGRFKDVESNIQVVVEPELPRVVWSPAFQDNVHNPVLQAGRP